ncbi:MAG: tRNA adenosine(34) deaminase TadA [Thermodesulfobacteriota bacterium]
MIENVVNIYAQGEEAEGLHRAFMAEALTEASKAAAEGEVPVGAVITREGSIIARGYNRKESAADPTLHGEIVAVREAARALKAWRLAETTLYVTLEPCVMCMGALLQARVPRLVFGAADPKAGACGSVFDLSNDRRLNHSIDVIKGVYEVESGNLLKGFFKKLRKR